MQDASHQNAVLYVFHPIMIFLKNLPSSGKVKVFGAEFAPGQVGQPVEVVPCDTIKHDMFNVLWWLNIT